MRHWGFTGNLSSPGFLFMHDANLVEFMATLAEIQTLNGRVRADEVASQAWP